MPNQPRKHALPGKIETIMATASEYLAAKREELLQRLLVNSHYSVQEEWTYDNWDGGQYGHALTFRVPRTIFPELIGRTEELSERLRDLLNEINPVQNEFVAKVFFEIEPGKGEDWRAASGALLPRDHAGDVMLRASAGAWATEQCRLFISHVSASKAVAHALKRDFSWYGVAAFVAHDDIEPTAVWQREIESALATMNAMLALGTTGFRASHWCQQEVGWALGRGVPIVALRAGEDPVGFVAATQALSADLTAHAEVTKRVMKLLLGDRRTSALAREAVVSKVESMESWELLRDLIDCLVEVPEITVDQLDRLERACKSNGHLGSSHSLPILRSFMNRNRRSSSA